MRLGAVIGRPPAGPGGSPLAQADPAGLAKARDRIKHVVVLMLENRSFDHVFGYLPIPGLTPPDPSTANPLDPADPTAAPAEPAAPSGRHILQCDPPHGHASAKVQMGSPSVKPGDDGACPMDGFVAAYRLKLEGKEHIPVFHWGRIRITALLLSPLLAFGVRDLWFLVRGKGWPPFLIVTLLLLVLLGSLILRSATATKLAGVKPWKSIAGVAAGGVGGGLLIQGLWRAFADASWWLIAWAVIGAGAAFAATVKAEKAIAKKRRPLAGTGAAERETLSRRIMHCQPEEHVKVLGALAKGFALCTRWHASVPGATWPNRNFLHTGSSEQSVDIEVGLYGDATLFNALDEAAAHPGTGAPLTSPPWRIYYDGMPQVIVFERLLAPELTDRWRPLDQFFQDLSDGKLASYTFLEPRHDGGHTSSYHPGNNQHVTDDASDFARGEELVREVYTALRQSKFFDDTVFVVTFDEHGGLFDRVSPPKTVPPQWGHALRHPKSTTRRAIAWFVEVRNAPFDFRRLGMRVPTIIVSPRIRAQLDDNLYDHTSVISTVCDLFAPEALYGFGQRSSQARPFWPLVDLDTGRSDTPEVPPPGYPPEPWPDSPAAVAAAQVAPPADAPPPPPNLTGGDLVDQLNALVPKLHTLLDTQGAPPAGPAPAPPAFAAAAPSAGETPAAKPTAGDGVMARIDAWAGQPDGAPVSPG